jgi:hypothetical protein
MKLRAVAMGCVIGVVSVTGGCAEDGDDLGLDCDPRAEPCVIEKTVSTYEIAAGVEDEDVCQSWTLDNPTELWVTGIAQTNTGAYHHANWFFVPDDTFELPDGTWSCRDENFQEFTAAILGGYLFALSTQSTYEAQELPAGGAIRIPPYSRLIGASHLLNASDQTVVTDMHIALTTVPPDQVSASMAPTRLSYIDLALPPESRSSFSTECAIGDTHQEQMGEPWTYVLYYALSHYHVLGVYAQLELVGGQRDGEVVFRHDGYGENLGIAIDPPLDVAATGATGLRFTCGFDNPREQEVGWGIGDQEMCVLALQADTNMGFDGSVIGGAGEQLDTVDGEIRYGGPCAGIGIPWDHDKPGGQH